MSFLHTGVGSACFQVSVLSFEEFKQYIETEIPSGESYVYRGHLSSEWSLEPSLFRGLNIGEDSRAKALAEEQLMLFKDRACGLTGMSPDTPDDTWWALGQHMGLNTPLLDWSTSPYVALFFAFADIDEYQHWTENRVVYALSRSAIESKNAESPFDSGDREHLLEFIDPPIDENPRLASQMGLLTICPTWARIDDMIEMDFDDEPHRRVLTRILVPDKQRLACLGALDDMGINHLKLFPDLTGAAKSCNLSHDLKHAAHSKSVLSSPIKGST